MELLKNLKFICRVCGTDTIKPKRVPASRNTGRWIFKTPDLKDKLEKYLFIKIDKNDQLPKKLCALCYCKVQSLEAFVDTAKKTEKYLTDFIQISQNNALSASAIQFQDEFIQYAMLANKKSSLLEEDPLLAQAVVVNVSSNEPLTTDMGMQMIEAQREKQGKLAEKKKNTGVIRWSSNPTTSLQQKRQNLKSTLLKAVRDIVVRPVPECEKVAVAAPTISPPPLQISVRPFAKETSNECLNLGSVIKDLDLLKLILKALKWPFNSHTLEAQMERLKRTRFRDVMVDPNLLQDTDMMQILSSYLGPILQQSTQIPLLPPPLTPIPSNQTHNIISPLAYKLPPETSIQVISTGEVAASKAPPKKRRRPIPKAMEPTVILVSDDESNVDTERFEVSVDPMSLLAQGDSSNSNEAMLAQLNAQRKLLMEKRQGPTKEMKKARKRKQSLSMVSEVAKNVNSVIEVDDDIEITTVVDPGTRPNATKKRILWEGAARVLDRNQPSTSKAAYQDMESFEDADDEPRLIIDVEEDEDFIEEELPLELAPKAETSKEQHVPLEEKESRTFADADSTTKICNRDKALTKTVNSKAPAASEGDEARVTQSNVAVGEGDADKLEISLSGSEMPAEEDETVDVIELLPLPSETDKVDEDFKELKVQEEKEDNSFEEKEVHVEEIKNSEANETSEETSVKKKRGRKPKPLEPADQEDHLTRHRQSELKKLEIENKIPELIRRPRLSKTFSKYYKGPAKKSSTSSQRASGRRQSQRKI